LQHYIEGAKCLDLFAGTGALGFEALSQGAAKVTMVDAHKGITESLRLHAKTLGAEGLEIICADAQQWLEHHSNVYDLVFLDPPFSQNLLGKVTSQLIDKGHLQKGSIIYIESDDNFEYKGLPLKMLKKSRAGNVKYMLFEYLEN